MLAHTHTHEINIRATCTCAHAHTMCEINNVARTMSIVDCECALRCDSELNFRHDSNYTIREQFALTFGWGGSCCCILHDNEQTKHIREMKFICSEISFRMHKRTLFIRLARRISKVIIIDIEKVHVFHLLYPAEMKWKNPNLSLNGIWIGILTFWAWSLIWTSVLVWPLTFRQVCKF